MIKIIGYLIQNYWPYLFVIAGIVFVIWFFRSGFRNARIAREKETKIYKDALEKEIEDSIKKAAKNASDHYKARQRKKDIADYEMSADAEHSPENIEDSKRRFRNTSDLDDCDQAFLNEIY